MNESHKIRPEDIIDPKTFGDRPDPFVAEVHTGKRVLGEVADLLSVLDGKADLDGRKEIALENVRTNKAAWESLVASLPERERKAFECALAQGLENLYYTHYNAARSMKNSQEI